MRALVQSPAGAMSMLWLPPPSSRRGGYTTAKGCHWPGHQVESLPQVPAGAWPRKPDRMRHVGRPGRPITEAMAVRLRTNSLRGVMGRGGAGVKGLWFLWGLAPVQLEPTLGIMLGHLPAQPPRLVPNQETARCRHVRGTAAGHESQRAPAGRLLPRRLGRLTGPVNWCSPGVPHQNRERHSRPRVHTPVHHVAPAGLHSVQGQQQVASGGQAAVSFK